MFEDMKGMMQQFQMLQRLMQNEDFKAFITHPKVQLLFQDPEFKELAKTQDFFRIVSHPKFTGLARDPEVAALLAKLDPKKLMGGA